MNTKNFPVERLAYALIASFTVWLVGHNLFNHSSQVGLRRGGWPVGAVVTTNQHHFVSARWTNAAGGVVTETFYDVPAVDGWGHSRAHDLLGPAAGGDVGQPAWAPGAPSHRDSVGDTNLAGRVHGVQSSNRDAVVYEPYSYGVRVSGSLSNQYTRRFSGLPFSLDARKYPEPATARSRR